LLAGCGAGGGSSSTHTAQPPAAKRLTDAEPNDAARQAIGPIGPAGVVLSRQSPHDDLDYFYLKMRPGRHVQLTVKHLAGQCDNSFVQTQKPRGGQDQTATAANAPVIDENNNQDTSVGNTPGTVQTAALTYDAAGSRIGVEVGFMKYASGGPYATADCAILVTASPASALITERSPADAAELALANH
jgi:hypothetical protein